MWIPALGLACLFLLGSASQPGAAETPLPRPAHPVAETDAEGAEDAAAPAVDPVRAGDLFAMPRVTEASRAALGDGAGGRSRRRPSAMLDALVARIPASAGVQANRAALAMLAGEPEAARAGLLRAAEIGFPGLAASLADPLFAPLAADPGSPRWPPRPPPTHAPVAAPVADGVALVSAANTAWNPATERLEPRFALPRRARRPVLPPTPKVAAWDILREHAKRGRAAGNHGDLYDNRDRGHSRLDPAAHPAGHPRRLFRRRPRRRRRLRAERQPPLRPRRPSATPRPRSPAARSGAACRATR